MTLRRTALVATLSVLTLQAEDFNLRYLDAAPVTLHTTLTYEGKSERLVATAKNESETVIKHAKICVVAKSFQKECLFELWNTEPLRIDRRIRNRKSFGDTATSRFDGSTVSGNTHSGRGPATANRDSGSVAAPDRILEPHRVPKLSRYPSGRYPTADEADAKSVIRGSAKW